MKIFQLLYTYEDNDNFGKISPDFVLNSQSGGDVQQYTNTCPKLVQSSISKKSLAKDDIETIQVDTNSSVDNSYMEHDSLLVIKQ